PDGPATEPVGDPAHGDQEQGRPEEQAVARGEQRLPGGRVGPVEALPTPPRTPGPRSRARPPGTPSWGGPAWGGSRRKDMFALVRERGRPATARGSGKAGL